MDSISRIIDLQILLIYILRLIILLSVVKSIKRVVLGEVEKRRVIFETVREAEVWAGGFVNEMYERVFDGYETPDYKIAYALSFLLAQN